MPDGADEKGHAAPGGVLAATCISTLIVNANTSAVAILLPAIGEDVGAPVSTLQWAVTGYSLVGAACIVTSGALGDVFGRRKVFLGGLGLFIVSSVLLAFTGSGAGVIIGRCIQGAAGSTILASGLSLLTVASSGTERLRGVSLWGAASAVGAAAGPLVGGVLVDTTGWQGLFWFSAAIGAVCVPITLRTVTESFDPDRPRSIDWAGTVLVAAILAPFILGISEGGDWGWTSLATLGCFFVSLASIVLFVRVERSSTAPLVDLGLLRNKVLIGATVGILIGAGTINGLMFVVSLYFQNPAALDLSPLQAGLATLPATVGLVVFAPVVPRLAARWGTRIVVLVGFVLTTAGFVAFVLADESWRYAAFVIPMVVVAAGMALTNGPCSAASTSAVREEQVGSASGISNMARYVGTSVWTAVVAAVYATTGENHLAAGEPTSEALAAALSRVGLVLALTTVPGIAIALLAGRHRPPEPGLVDVAAAASSTSHTLPTPHPDRRPVAVA